jgi:hypothetical protein
MADSLVNAVKKTAGPQSVDELIRKGPPTRDEIEAIMEKGALGLVASDEEQAILTEYHSRIRRADNLSVILGILYPTCEWTLNTVPGAEWKVGDSGLHPGAIEALEWDEDNPLPKPTFAELKKLRPYVQDILDQQSYIDLRAANYPREDAMIRALWEYIIEGNKEGVDALQARRLAVKKRFPKPENKHWMVQSEEYMRIYPNSPEDILRDIDEEQAKKIAFSPHLESEDALPLSTKLALEERIAKVMDARGMVNENSVNSNVTLSDVDKKQAELDAKEESSSSEEKSE